MKNYFVKVIFIFFFLFSTPLFTQQKFILVESTGTAAVPANEIIFIVNLAVENQDPQKAYEKHKELENNILQIIKDFGVADSNITFSLLNINNINAMPKENTFRTYQAITIRLLSIKQYEPFQIALLSNGIFNFSSQFASNDISSGQDKSLTDAINKAREKAESISKKLNRKIGKILEIESAERNFIPMDVRFSTMEKGGGLVDIPQQIQVSTTIKIKYELTE